MLGAVEEHAPELIIAPMLKVAIPKIIWARHTCLIVHPGVKGDRGPSSLDWAIATGDDYLSELGAAEVAVALRRYRLDRGAYPDELAALVPAYLAELPVNPFTAKPPVYARQATGFTLTAPRSEIHTRAVPPTPEWTVNR